MPSFPDDEKDDSVERHRFNALLRHLARGGANTFDSNFGRERVSWRRGKTHDELYITVSANTTTLEFMAQELKMKVRVRDSRGGGWEPFTQTSKREGKFRHPQCRCDDDDANCDCCKNSDAQGHCHCCILTPAQQSVLVRRKLQNVCDSWVREITDGAVLAKGLHHALEEEWIEKIFPMHTLHHDNDFYNGRTSFLKRYCTGGAMISTPFNWTHAHNRFTSYFFDYFGSKVSMYFGFLHFLTTWLVWLAIPGAVLALWQWGDASSDNRFVPFFCLIVAFWAALNHKYWVRKQSAYSFHWNTLDFEEREEELESFTRKAKKTERNEEDENEADTAALAALGDRAIGFYEQVSGEIFVDLEEFGAAEIAKDPSIEPFLPKTHRFAKGKCPNGFFCCVSGDEEAREEANTACWRRFQQIISGSAILTLMFCVIIITISLLIFRLVVQEVNQTFGGIVAGFVNAITIIILDWVYQKVAVKLNDWEQHRTATRYEDKLIAKIIPFTFVNSYCSLFWIAFVKGNNSELFGHTDECEGSCMGELSSQLTSLMFSRMVIGNFTETGLPWIKNKLVTWWNVRKKRGELADEHPDWSNAQLQTEIERIGLRQSRISRVEREAYLPTYSQINNVSGVFGDMLELAVNVGYVLLFAPAVCYVIVAVFFYCLFILFVLLLIWF